MKTIPVSQLTDELILKHTNKCVKCGNPTHIKISLDENDVYVCKDCVSEVKQVMMINLYKDGYLEKKIKQWSV